MRLRLAAAVLLLAASSQAAYHYVHYPSRNAFTPIFERYNLDALQNKTLTFTVADQSPNVYGSEDFGSILAEIRQAAAAWNSVAISDLRVAFGGIQNYTPNPTAANPGFALPQASTPGADIVFVDTPGVLGLGSRTVSTVPAQGASGQYFPIVRGVVMISRDSSRPPWPSSAETFFTTAVHEMGHALGLQHTWTGSAMSQGVVRMTSRARPLDSDDVASLAVLYGKPGWQGNYGSISGSVNFANNGFGVSMASVVAISPTGPAISTLTNPDGSYRIDGIPAGYNYYVYAHPLPPDALPLDNTGVQRPVDFSNTSFTPSGPFQTVFWAGGAVTLDLNQASSLPVGPGSLVSNVNFSVQPVSTVRAYNVRTFTEITAATRMYYTYLANGDTQVLGYPGFINVVNTAANLAGAMVQVQADGSGLLPTPQSVQVLGSNWQPATLANGVAQKWPGIYPQPSGALALYLVVPTDAGTGARHMVFNFGDDLYVMPNSLDLVQKGPPVASAAFQNGDGTVSVMGAGFAGDSRVFFDGAQASVLSFNGSDAQGILTVIPPPGANGHSASVTVYNSDGQNSRIISSAPIPTYLYPASGPAQIASANPLSVAAGATAMIDITVTNMNLVDGQVTVGFGSDDIQVRRVWVVSPNRVLVNVVVAANASVGLSEISVISGMQVAYAQNSFQVSPARAGAPVVISVANTDLTQSAGVIYGLNLAGATAALNDIPLNLLYSSPNQINFAMPAGLTAGPAVLRLTSASGAAYPVAVQIDSAPFAITGVNTFSAGPGDIMTVNVAGLDPAIAASPQRRLRVTLSGLEMPIQSVVSSPLGAQIQIVVTQSFASAQVPLAVVADGTPSAPMAIAIR